MNRHNNEQRTGSGRRGARAPSYHQSFAQESSSGPPILGQPKEGKRNNGLVFRNGAWHTHPKL